MPTNNNGKKDAISHNNKADYLSSIYCEHTKLSKSKIDSQLTKIYFQETSTPEKKSYFMYFPSNVIAANSRRQSSHQLGFQPSLCLNYFNLVISAVKLCDIIYQHFNYKFRIIINHVLFIYLVPLTVRLRISVYII